MATSGKVPTLGFLARIRNIVWLGFGSGDTSSLPDIIHATLRTRVAVSTLDAKAADYQQRTRAAVYSLRYRG